MDRLGTALTQLVNSEPLGAGLAAALLDYLYSKLPGSEPMTEDDTRRRFAIIVAATALAVALLR